MIWYYWIIISLFALIFFFVIYLFAKRNRLLKKYNNDKEIVGWIMHRKIWLGQTKEQLLDSLGKPVSSSQQVLKTKIKEQWKYAKTGKNRYNLKVSIEDGEVVGWDKKN